MAFKLAEAYVEFGQRGLRGLTGVLGGIHRRIMGLLTPTRLVTGALATMGAALTVRQFARVFAEQEQAEFRLRGALEANGRAVDALFGDYRRFASQMQDITTVGDEATLAILSQAEALGLTGEAAKRAAKEAIGLARGSSSRMSPQSAIRYVAALQQGDTSLLTRYIPTLRDISDESEKVAEAHKRLAVMFEIAKAESQSTTGAFAQMRNAVGDVMEEIARSYAETFDLAGTAQRVRDFAKSFWSDYGLPITNAFVAIRQVGRNAWLAINDVVKWVMDRSDGILDPLRQGFVGLRDTVLRYADVMLASWEGFRAGLAAMAAATQAVFQLAWDHITLGFEQMLETIRNSFSGFVDDIGDYLRGLPEKMSAAMEQSPMGAAGKLGEKLRVQLGQASYRLQGTTPPGVVPGRRAGGAGAFAAAMAGPEKDWAQAGRAAAEGAESQFAKRRQEINARFEEMMQRVADQFADATDGLAKISDAFKTELPEQIPEPAEPPDGGAPPPPPPKAETGQGFQITSLAGLASQMQEQAARRLQERTASATERTADAVERLADGREIRNIYNPDTTVVMEPFAVFNEGGKFVNKALGT